jgi:two-component system, OmpR family, response regulator
MKILVVDDDPAMLLVASIALQEVGGFEVISASGGVEAIQFARDTQPDAILMDLVMHDLTGPDVLQTLRSSESTGSIPIIFHTARTDPSDVRHLLSMGAKGVIGKPINPMDLPAEVTRILAS